MADSDHIKILEQGVVVWNKWREEHRNIKPDLSGARLIGADLSGASLSGTDLSGADLSSARLIGADLSSADLISANLSGADLSGADLSVADLISARLIGADLSVAELSGARLSGARLNNADLSGADLTDTDLSGARLSGANLSYADLTGAYLKNAYLTDADLSDADLSDARLNNADLSRVSLVGAQLANADLTGCRIFGISAWKVGLEGAIQKNLVITDYGEPEITVDNLKIAQFIYLLLNNEEIRDVIDTITSKVVLILGRFTPKRKLVLDALRDELRKHNFSPIVFDFDPSAKRGLTETISLLANMSRFVIADITNAKSIPQELQAIVPHLPSVIVQPILQARNREFAMFEHYARYSSVLPIYYYQDIPSLLASVKEHIIMPVEQKEREKDKTKDLEDTNRKLKRDLKNLKEEIRIISANNYNT